MDLPPQLNISNEPSGKFFSALQNMFLCDLFFSARLHSGPLILDAGLNEAGSSFSFFIQGLVEPSMGRKLKRKLIQKVEIMSFTKRKLNMEADDQSPMQEAQL